MRRDPIQELEESAEKANALRDSTEVLEVLLSGGFSVWTDGSLYYIKQLVKRVNGLKIEIYAREHPPPHFHVKGSGIDAAFTLDDCSLFQGQIDGREESLVRWWYKKSRPILIETWNKTRPSDCTVGEFVE